MRTYKISGRVTLCAGLLVGVSAAWSTGCSSNNKTADMAGSPDLGGLANAPLKISSINTRVDVAQQFRASLEMQQSGEPLAQAMGRNLNGYNRYQLPTNLYTDPATGKATVDSVGFSTGVESYEYSKYAMNSMSFQLGAGLSLMYGPVVNPGQAGSQATGSAAINLLQARVQLFGVGSHAGVVGMNGGGPFVTVPAPVGNALNPLGFPGLWAEFAEFDSVQPTIMPSGNVARGCSLVGGYGAGTTAQIVGDYECGYNTMHLVDRDGQVTDNGQKVLAADALGYAVWKQSLWITNYFQVVHDTMGNQYTALMNPADAPNVGMSLNTVAAQNSDGKAGPPGTFIGSSDLEGFQGQLMTEEVQNKAEFLLTSMTTNDGLTLGSFQSAAGTAVQVAILYDYTSPLRYIPHQVTVVEAAGQASADPQPTTLAMLSGVSMLADQSGLLGGYSDYFALTDQNNSQVGGILPAQVVFDGNPFPLDNGLPDGEATAHDRALAMIKVALVNMDRMHADPKSGVLSDQVTVSGTGKSQTLVRSNHASTVETAAAIVALRNAYRSLTSQLTLYSNSTPDQVSAATVLDATNPKGIPGGVTLSQRILALIQSQADFLSNTLADSNGLAINGYNLATGAADAGPVTLESQAALIRGLLAASLVLSNNTYRDRAQQAYDVLDSQFYDPALRVYSSALGNTQSFTFTPLRFATLQAALREMYELIGAKSGHETLGAELETRIARLNKLVLNGWDDANGDNLVDWPGECMQVTDTLPRGGLQMAEQALTGEVGSLNGVLTDERDKDCVPQIVGAQLAAMLASQVVIERR